MMADGTGLLPPATGESWQKAECGVCFLCFFPPLSVTSSSRVVSHHHHWGLTKPPPLPNNADIITVPVNYELTFVMHTYFTLIEAVADTLPP